MTDQDREILVHLLLANFLVSSLIGFALAWYLRGQFEEWRWFKRGIRCDDCAPLLHSSMDAKHP